MMSWKLKVRLGKGRKIQFVGINRRRSPADRTTINPYQSTASKNKNLDISTSQDSSSATDAVMPSSFAPVVTYAEFYATMFHYAHALTSWNKPSVKVSNSMNAQSVAGMTVSLPAASAQCMMVGVGLSSGIEAVGTTDHSAAVLLQHSSS